ncbi:hypothetical protein VKT23_008163 [Stygiomarasmius scandens]|uniref:Uncharacterized protein n=1 Tax=Marasmiellus scandens TaxID=2682957 RepID=A0ABR1JNL5_9AGAR
MKTRENLLQEVYVKEDIVIQLGTISNVKVDGPFEGRTDWLVEKLIIGTRDTSILTAPSTFIDSNDPKLPIANPSNRPWMIKAGDVVGHLVNPDKLDNPKGNKFQRYSTSVEIIRSQIQGSLRAQDLYNSTNLPPDHAALPDETPGTEGKEPAKVPVFVQ